MDDEPAGVPIEMVGRRLGNARTSITNDVYSHVTPKADDGAAAKVAETICVGGASS